MSRFLLSALVLLASGGYAQTTTPQTAPPYRNTSLPAAERAHDLVSRMTLEEKASQLEDWAVSIPRLGIPDYQTWSEALHGVANAGHATVFPQAIGMAATWDSDLVRQMGDVISTEGRAKYNQAQREGNHRIFYGLTFWSPNINIFRDPRWGRGQETYGEDPFLTGRMGVAFIRGVQGDDPLHPRAIATAKHFAVHSGPESLRHVFNVNVSPRDLEETYLPAFRAAVTEGGVKSVMCAYNAVNGTAACSNSMLLQQHLRQAWGFKGFVVSDCGAIVDVANGHHNAPDIMHAAVLSINAGTDLSCSVWTPGFNTLADAVKQKLVSEKAVTEAAERLYTARMELGMFDPPEFSQRDSISSAEVASAEHRAMAQRAAEESMVLLKNNGVLPLRQNPGSIAVIGPTADLLADLEGNYNGQPVHPVTPLDGILSEFYGSTVHYAQGAPLTAGFYLPVPRTAFPGGLQAEYFATPDWTGKPVAIQTESRIQHDWRDAAPLPEVQTHNYSVRWSGTFRAPAPGKYTFVVEGISAFPYAPEENFRLKLDGHVLANGDLNGEHRPGTGKPAPGAAATAPPIMPDSKPVSIEINVADTAPHAFEFEYSHSGDRAGGGITLNWIPPANALLADAVAAAKASDVVIAFTGLSPRLEGEEMPIVLDGFNRGDRTSIDLPQAQQAMLNAVASTGRPVIVVNLSGSAVALRWASENAAAVLQAWYPGVAGGTAIAATLRGSNNPAGRLPVTFYAGTGDLPPFTDYSMKNRTYRYYTGKPLWGFGYGLSYTTFHYGEVHLSEKDLAAGDPLSASVTVTNTGKADGDEVVEAYIKTPQEDGALRSLAAFKRIHLAAGESQQVVLDFSPRSLSSVNTEGKRSVLPGNYHLSIGSAQPDETTARVDVDFTVTGTKSLPE